MKRKLLTAIMGLCAAEGVVWTWFRLRRPKPWRPVWLTSEVDSLRNETTCETPTICQPWAPECGTCRRARAQFTQERTEAITWASLDEWQRESWRREVAA